MIHPDRPFTDAEERLARLRPKPHDAATLARACRCLRQGDRLAWHDLSFVRGMAATAMWRTPSPEQSKRLEDIAWRVGAEP